ncbi:MAG: hypothetical protein Q9174_005455, partial [Haloplaca sp. 1 TL-2023]
SDGFGSFLYKPSTPMDGMSTGYLFCYGITASISGANSQPSIPPVARRFALTDLAAFAVNMPNVTRYARNSRSSTLAQALISLEVRGAPTLRLRLLRKLPVTLAASSEVIYGEVLWNPLEIVQIWDDRAGKFFGGLLFAFANIGTNVAGNSISFANDLMTVFPKQVNIRFVESGSTPLSRPSLISH